MRTLALIVELVWRAICHHLAYPAHKIGSKWLRRLEVKGGLIIYGDGVSKRQYGAPVAELDLRFAATISRRYF